MIELDKMTLPIQLTVKEPSFQIQEAFNTLRTNLIFSGENQRVFLITSALPNEGKSYVSFELARNFSMTGKRTLYMDCDLRKSVVRERFQIASVPNGITEDVSGQCDQIIYRTNFENLYMIFSWTDSAESFCSALHLSCFQNLLKVLREVFDYIIIDSPPVSSVSDASVIASQTDGIVMVVRDRFITRNIVRRCQSQLMQAGGNIVGVLLNRAEKSRPYSGYYGGAYYYNK